MTRGLQIRSKIVWLVRRPILVVTEMVFAMLFVVVALYSRWKRKGVLAGRVKPRLFWGSVPILNNKYWALAMRRAGYMSRTFTTDFYQTINAREDWDLLLSEEYRGMPAFLHPYLGFLRVLRDFDVVFTSFDGVFIGRAMLGRWQALFFRLAGIRVVAIPYGADAYVYRNVRSTALLQGLLASYPQLSRRQDEVERQVAYWCRHADAVIPGFMGPDGFGRWDVILPSQLFIDIDQWQPSTRSSSNDEVVICHAPNHRGFKGTEFVVEAVERLRAEGLNVRLKLLERMQNDEVRRVLREEADVLVEQLVFTGHGLNGLEGLATGLPVVANLDDAQYTTPLRGWSYLGECPIVSASIETIVPVLRALVTRPELRESLKQAGRQYVEKYHGLNSAVHLFEAVLDYVYGRRESLINLYHPLLGEYPRRLPRVEHPLVNNRIVD